jgi:hypothetical protein
VTEKEFKKQKIAPAPWIKVENNGMIIDHPRGRGDLLMQNALGASDGAFMGACCRSSPKRLGRRSRKKTSISWFLSSTTSSLEIKLNPH